MTPTTNSSTLRAFTLAMMLVTAAGCSSGDGSSTATTSGLGVAGVAQAPNGILAKAPMTGKQWLASLFTIAESYAIDITGWTGVGAASVRVFHIDDSGVPTGAVIATSTTNPDGSFNLILPNGTSFTSDLIAQIENDVAITGPMPVGTANTLSVPIVGGSVNINPATNAATQALVNRPEPLANFTPAEVAQLLAVVETLATEEPPAATTLAAILLEINTDFGTQMTAALNALSATSPTPLTILTTGFPNGFNNSPYSRTALAVGGTGALSWNVVANDALPQGLNLNANTGTISGTPPVPEVAYFSLRVRDAASTEATRAFSIQIDGIPAAPSFTTHPGNSTVTAGQIASFLVSVTGLPTPTLQWQRSTDGGTTWTNIPGATGSGFTTAATTLADNGNRFRVEATNSANGGVSVTSNAAVLTVNPSVVASFELKVLDSASFVFLIKGGRVTDNLGHIDCSGYTGDAVPCPSPRAFYPSGTHVTLTATPWPNWRVSGWAGSDCFAAGTVTSVTLTIDHNSDCLPQFEVIPGSTFSLTVALASAWMGEAYDIVFNRFGQVFRGDPPTIDCGPNAASQICVANVAVSQQLIMTASPLSAAPAGTVHWTCQAPHPDDPVNRTINIGVTGSDITIPEFVGNTQCSVDFVPTP